MNEDEEVLLPPRVTRRAPLRVFDSGAFGPAHHRVFGEQTEWGWAIPMLYRWLASPFTGEPMPSAPKHPGTAASCGYWAALLHLLLYPLGWSQPGRGIQLLYEGVTPMEDLRFWLIDRVWRQDGRLDAFAAWLWGARPTFELATCTEELASRPAFDRDSGFGEAWIADAIANDERIARAAGGTGSFLVHEAEPGSDPLHLAMHCSGPLERDDDAERHWFPFPDVASAILVTDSMTGWYRVLLERPQHLASVDHVDIVVRSVGWLGTWRRSPETGLWHTAPHQVHLMGN